MGKLMLYPTRRPGKLRPPSAQTGRQPQSGTCQEPGRLRRGPGLAADPASREHRPGARRRGLAVRRDGDGCSNVEAAGRIPAERYNRACAAALRRAPVRRR